MARLKDVPDRRMPGDFGHDAEVGAALAKSPEEARAQGVAQQTGDRPCGGDRLEGHLIGVRASQEMHGPHRQSPVAEARGGDRVALDSGANRSPGGAAPGLVQVVHGVSPQADLRESGKRPRRPAAGRRDADDPVGEERIAAVRQGGDQGGLADADGPREQGPALRRRNGARVKHKDAAHLQAGGEDRVQQADGRVPDAALRREENLPPPFGDTAARNAVDVEQQRAGGSGTNRRRNRPDANRHIRLPVPRANGPRQLDFRLKEQTVAPMVAQAADRRFDAVPRRPARRGVGPGDSRSGHGDADQPNGIIGQPRCGGTCCVFEPPFRVAERLDVVVAEKRA